MFNLIKYQLNKVEKGLHSYLTDFPIFFSKKMLSIRMSSHIMSFAHDFPWVFDSNMLFHREAFNPPTYFFKLDTDFYTMCIRDLDLGKRSEIIILGSLLTTFEGSLLGLILKPNHQIKLDNPWYSLCYFKLDTL